MVKKIALMWVPEGLEPLTSCKHYRIPYPTLKEAVDAALNDDTSDKPPRHLPWLRAGTGKGAAVLNIQGIRLLQAAFNEGMASFKP